MRERPFWSLFVAVVVAGTAAYVPYQNRAVAPASTRAARQVTRGVAAADSAQRTPEQIRQVASTHSDAATLIGAHFGLEVEPDEAWFPDARQPSSALEDTYPDVRRLRRVRARAGSSTVSFLIATLPDPIDSSSRWQFDPLYDAVQRGVIDSGYSFERFYIPDWDPGRGAEESASLAGVVHEQLPGVVLFTRRVAAAPGAEREELLVLLLVFETPTNGVHQVAFQRAARTAFAWNPAADVRVLGPTYSGSIPSLGRAMVSSGVHAPYRVVTGSATSPRNRERLQAIVGAGASTYRSTVLTDDDLQSAMFSFLDERFPSARVAALVEGNTAYGGALTADLRKERGTGNLLILPFPLHISRLRAATVVQPPAAGAPDGRQGLPLALDEPTSPRDRVPALSPKLTESGTEAVLSNILDTLERERVTVIGLLATDARDKLFLAQQVATRVADAQLFTFEGDLLFTHPQYQRYTKGMLVASSYPLFTITQAWQPSGNGFDRRQQFPSENAHGTYNATLAILNYDDTGKPLPDGRDPQAVPPLLDYGTDLEGHFGPHAWVSAVGTRAVWPLRRVACGPVNERACAAQLHPVKRPGRGAPPHLMRLPPATTALLILCLALGAMHLAMWLRRGLRPTTLWFNAGQGMLPPVRTLARTCGVALTLLMAWLALIASWYVTAFPTAVGAWPALVVTSALMGVLAVSTVVMSPRTSGTHDALLLVAGGAAGVLVGLVALGPLGAIVAGGDETLVLVTRGLDPFSGESPFLPVLVVLIALYLWAVVQLARVGVPTLSSALELAVGLDGLARGGLTRPIGRIRQIVQGLFGVPWGLATCTFLLLVPPLALFRIIETPERGAFDQVFTVGWYMLQIFVCHAIAHLVALWRAIRRVLSGLSVHESANGFERVPRDLFMNRLTPRGPALLHLQLAANLQSSAAGFWLPAAAVGPVLDTDFQQRPRPHLASSAAWRALLDDAQALMHRLAANRAGGAAPSARQSVADVMVLMPIALMLKEMTSRTVRGIYAVVAFVAALLIYQASLPGHDQRAMLAATWMYVAIGSLAVLVTAISAERDVVLSRLAGTTGGKIHWDAAFIARAVLPIILALATLFATQFPDAGAALLRIVRPVQTVLP
jgi:hypothetical protein